MAILCSIFFTNEKSQQDELSITKCHVYELSMGAHIKLIAMMIHKW